MCDLISFTYITFVYLEGTVLFFSDDVATVIHSDDAIAPVGFLNFNKFHLIDKEVSTLPL